VVRKKVLSLQPKIPVNVIIMTTLELRTSYWY